MLYVCHSFIYSFIHLFIHSFIHSCIIIKCFYFIYLFIFLLQNFGSVIIKVEDINDNPPKFAEKIYKGTVDENSSTGTEVYFDVSTASLFCRPASVIHI